MPYNQFTLNELKKRFALVLAEDAVLFPVLPAVTASALLRQVLAEHIPLALAIHTEKARSELIIAPILVEVRRLMHHRVSLFSGVDFSVEPEQGLNGICDFIFSRSPEQLYIAAPVVLIVEAKNENIKAGLPQCIAAMVAAQRFNQREDNSITTIYGAVTTGNIWKFLRLESATVSIDQGEYYLNQVDSILAALVYAIGGAAAAAYLAGREDHDVIGA